MRQNFRKKYKIVEIDNFPLYADNITEINLWPNEKRGKTDNICIRIEHYQRNLKYMSNCATFVFSNIPNFPIYNFFYGKKIDYEYWNSHCVEASEPIIYEDLDLKVVDNELNKCFKRMAIKINGKQIKLAKDFADYYSVDTHHTNVYNCLYKIFEHLDYLSNNKTSKYLINFTVNSIIEKAQILNKRYVYACKVIQWVCNMLQKREGDSQ